MKNIDSVVLRNGTNEIKMSADGEILDVITMTNHTKDPAVLFTTDWDAPQKTYFIYGAHVKDQAPDDGMTYLGITDGWLGVTVWYGWWKP